MELESLSEDETLDEELCEIVRNVYKFMKKEKKKGKLILLDNVEERVARATGIDLHTIQSISNNIYSIHNISAVVAMVWSKEHRDFAVRTYFESGHCYNITRQNFRRHFNIPLCDPIPHRKVIANWVQAFVLEETGSTKKYGKSTGRPKTARTPENIALVRAAVEESPTCSARKLAAVLNMSDYTVRRILHQDLFCHPDKIMVVEEELMPVPVQSLDIPTTSSSSAILPSRIQDCSDIHCNEDTKSNACFKESKVSVDALSNILVNILDEMCKVPGIQPFVYPVDPQLDPDYCQVVPNSINLQTIRNNLEQRRYHSRGEFLTDVKQIVENSHIYKTKCKKCSCDRNGRFLHLDCKNSQCVTQKMLNVCLERLNEKNQELLALERVINPLMFNEDQIAFTAILESVVSNKLKSMPEALPFHRPVNKSLVKDYYAVVTKPMDLESISKKVAAHKYHSRHEFLADVEQILHNCILYNGRDSQFTEKATRLVTACKSTLDKFDEGLAPLEKNLLLAQVKATENNDENVMSGDENYNQNSLESASFVKSETDDLIDIKQEEIQGVSDCELTKKLKEEPQDTREVSDKLQVKELEQDVKNVL